MPGGHNPISSHPIGESEDSLLCPPNGPAPGAIFQRRIAIVLVSGDFPPRKREDHMKKLLTYSQLKPEKGIPYCREHIRRLEDAGRFPKRTKLGDHPNARAAWLETEVDAWLDERVAARDSRDAD